MDVKIRSVEICLLVVAAVITRIVSREVCSDSYLNYRYCDDGYHCCEDNDLECCLDVNVNVGVIVGIVCGCLIGLSILISFICFIVKKSQRPTRVIRATGQPQHGIAMVTAGQHHGQPGYGQPSYGQPYHGQPPLQPGGQQMQGAAKPGQSDPGNQPPPPPAY